MKNLAMAEFCLANYKGQNNRITNEKLTDAWLAFY
jgi:hypothetical protein